MTAAGSRSGRWAARQAKLTGAELHAVTAWSLPEIHGYAPRDFEDDARNALESAIQEALGEAARCTSSPKSWRGIRPGVPIEASRRAQLLFVGSHGHSAFTGMLLGSVSQHCVTHAHRAVVVVRSQHS